MSSIEILPEHVVRKIAAGEVIERPASIVKELIENSLDSGATAIKVEVQAGGADHIQVTDNGRGIPREELPLTVVPHSTSKLRQFEDLCHLQSFGFRGEALASISAVCQFLIQSQHQDEDQGSSLRIETPEQLHQPVLGAYQGPVGTQISCRQLFYNVPARRKFLRRPQTEFGYILETIQAHCLSYPHVTWTFKHNGKTELYHAAITDHGDSLGALAGMTKQLLKVPSTVDLLACEGENHYLKLKALITPPGIDFPTRKRLFTFTNQRWLKDKNLNAMIIKGYHSHLLKGRYPGCVLWLQSDPSLIDINIHPSKKEIRFEYHNEVAKLIFATLQKSLRTPSWAAGTAAVSVAVSGEDAAVAPPLPTGLDDAAHLRSEVSFVSASTAHLAPLVPQQHREGEHSSHSPRAHSGPSAVKREELLRFGAHADVASPSSVGEVSSSAMSQPLFSASGGGAFRVESVESAEEEKSQNQNSRRGEDGPERDGSHLMAEAARQYEHSAPAIPWQRLRHVGSFAKVYLIFEDPVSHQLLFVDQHAFHERILFERLCRDQELLQQTQTLLIPQELVLPASQMGVLFSHQEFLESLGFVFERGQGDTGDSLSVTAVPSLLVRQSLHDVFESLASQLASHTLSEEKTKEILCEDILSTIACHAAIKGGESLGPQELQRLIAEAQGVDFYHNCPHGRRVFFGLSQREVARWFDR